MASNTSLVILSENDDNRTIAKKCNSNFESFRQTIDTVYSTESSSSADVDELRKQIAQVSYNLSNSIADLRSWTEQQLKDINSKISATNDNLSKLTTAVNNLRSDIVSMVYEAESKDGRVKIPDGTKIPTGNINVLSGSDKRGYIRTKKTEDSLDIWDNQNV